MFCKRCGKCIPDEAKFCGRCGTPVSATVITPTQMDVSAPEAAPFVSVTPTSEPSMSDQEIQDRIARVIAESEQTRNSALKNVGLAAVCIVAYYVLLIGFHIDLHFWLIRLDVVGFVLLAIGIIRLIYNSTQLPNKIEQIKQGQRL